MRTITETGTWVYAEQKLYELTVRGLEVRVFGEVFQGCLPPKSKTCSDNYDDSDDEDDDGDEDARGSRDRRGRRRCEHVVSEEDCFLTSANLCRWVIEADDLHLEEKVGMGSYGMVYRARWKGINVAVKRFVRQKLDERLMLEFRAEVALLSELHHPNIVLFIGTYAHAHAHAPPHTHTADGGLCAQVRV